MEILYYILDNKEDCAHREGEPFLFNIELNKCLLNWNSI